MNSLIRFKNIFFSLFLMFLNTSSFAQEECDCKNLSQKLLKNVTNQTDSLQVFMVINQLKASNTKSCVIEGLIVEFEFYRVARKPKKAYSILKKIEDLIGKSNCVKTYQFDLYYNKTLYYHAIEDLEKLSIFAFKSLKEAERLKNSKKQILAIKEIVFLFTRTNEDAKNWKYIKRAESLILDESKNKNSVEDYLWLAFEYENKFTLTERKSLLDTLFIYTNLVKKEAIKNNMNVEISQSYRALESYYYHKGDLKKGLINIDSAIYFGKKIAEPKNLSALYLSKAWDHLDLGQITEAIKWADTATSKGKSNSAGKMMLLLDVSELYQTAGKYEKAYTSYKKYSILKDSILSVEKIEKINELEQKYNKAINEKKIFELEKMQYLYLFIIFGSILFIISGFLYFRQRALKNKHKILETEQRLNRARINPHFFFNAMSSLQNLSLQEKSINTTLFISRFAKIMRQSLESTYEEVISVEEEIDFLTQYLEIQKLRFPNKFDFQFHVDDSLEINELKIPGMIIQPFVENSIEHGFKNIEYTGMIDISFQDTEKNYNIIVEDNGKGKNLVKKEQNHKSRAMQIIKDRLYLFNEQHNAKAIYIVEKTQTGKGFRIIITLPKIYS